MSEIPVYLLTWTTYGTWLHGDERGWVDRHNASPGMDYHPGNPGARLAAIRRTKGRKVILAVHARHVVTSAIEEVCRWRDWRLIAVNCRSNHVHVLVRTDGTGPQHVMNQFKSYATRALRQVGLAGPERIWTRGGSRRYITSRASLRSAEQYVRFQ